MEKQPIEKNKHYQMEIIDLGSDGEGIGKIDDFTADDYFSKIGLRANIQIEVDNIETVLALAHKDLGITVYPEMFLNHLSPMFKERDAASYFLIRDSGVESSLVAAYRRGKYLNKFHRVFIDICKETYGKEQELWR